MPQLSLFDTPDELAPQAARLAPRLLRLAEQGVYLGTSSWKYPGWVGSIYTAERYTVRGKFQTKQFQNDCLAEYAKTFHLVGGDFSFYTFPAKDDWRRLFEGTPDRLLFALKVPEEITAPVWPRHARYGPKAGQINPHFLNADIFIKRFLEPLEPYRQRVATLLFEFGTYAKSTFATPDAFLKRLDPFLARLPAGFRRAVEVRNAELLGEPYFATLASHNTAHVFNAWTRMPELADQMAMTGAFTANVLVARALLRRGRSYEQAVQLFEPYKAVQEPDPRGRAALRDLAREGLRRRMPTFLLVNNRYEGNSPSTIEAVVEALERDSGG